MRDKANFAILEGFLHSLLDEPVTIEQILESESNAESENARFNRVDLLVKDSEGRHVIIEVQNERESDYIERMLFGTSKLGGRLNRSRRALRSHPENHLDSHSLLQSWSGH